MTDSASPAGSLTYLRVVRKVADAGLSQEEIANAVGASLRTVQGWAAGSSTPKGIKAQRLLDLKYLVEELSEAYTEEGIQIWLHARNRNLEGRRPIELLAEGQTNAVMAEVDRVTGGM